MVNKIKGISKEAEEQYLADTIALAKRNLDRAKDSVDKLNDEIEELMNQINSTGDKEGLFLWNNAKAQLKGTIGEITRYEKARKKPYFGRIDFTDANGTQQESYYIGRIGIATEEKEPAVIDWRTPVASVYYENAMGPGTYTVSSEGTFDIDLKRKRSYEIENDRLLDFYDLDVVANDELLTKYLSRNKTEVLGEIIATIQKEQNRIIRRSPKTNIIVQGVAGSGKTTVAMHRISYILYNYENEIRPEDFYIIGSNRILLNYITGVLPELDVYGVRQMTMEELFVRLLYEDWDANQFVIRSLDKSDDKNWVKGCKKWFLDLQQFCESYESEHISRKPVYMEKTGKLLVGTNLIENYCKDNPLMSMQSKCLMLNEILYAKYENEILGKHVSFSPEEKKALEKKYSTYFGKDDWKGSIYELYQSFLQRQMEQGYDIDVLDTSFDVYDLAALAYIYKRIKEIDPIREATHVVIDEAQDFGMMAYECLHYCMRGCTYTIMGDTSQNIHFQYGLNDWNELKELVLTGDYDRFGLLRKSYRNTVEISNFATEILRHGDFAIYPVEPIIRHGRDVQTIKAKPSELIKQAADILSEWQRSGYETIAVICRDEREANAVSDLLKQHLTIKQIDLEATEFGSGVMVLPVVYTKGLEFDAVLIFNPTTEHYPADDGHVKMLYVTATRALHELAVLYENDLTPLLADKAPEGKHQESFDEEKYLDDDDDNREVVTQKEIIEQRKKDGSVEMQQRSYIGPKRIVLKENDVPSVSYHIKPDKESIPLVSKRVSQSKKAEEPRAGKQNLHAAVKPSVGIKDAINESPFLYGSIPDNKMLEVKGHTRPDCSVRWVKKTKTGVEVVSRYGVLTVLPLSEECVRIFFAKGASAKPVDSGMMVEPETKVKWTAKESPSVIEVATKCLIVHIEKKDGALRFLSPERKVLLSEKSSKPRLIEDMMAWNFFEFEKNEKIKSKGILATDLSDIHQKARYISFGQKQIRMPLILSSKGYALAIAAKSTCLFCGIPMYGPYIYTDGAQTIDYCFLYGGNATKNMELYKMLRKK